MDQIGVMRFLQMEWHRHERDRNAWEIERAEMKARIAKLEGENRSSKKLQDSFSSHIHLLETALKKEREKVKAMTAGGEATKGKDPVEADTRNRSPTSGGSQETKGQFFTELWRSLLTLDRPAKVSQSFLRNLTGIVSVISRRPSTTQSASVP